MGSEAQAQAPPQQPPPQPQYQQPPPPPGPEAGAAAGTAAPAAAGPNMMLIAAIVIVVIVVVGVAGYFLLAGDGDGNGGGNGDVALEGQWELGDTVVTMEIAGMDPITETIEGTGEIVNFSAGGADASMDALSGLLGYGATFTDNGDGTFTITGIDLGMPGVSIGDIEGEYSVSGNTMTFTMDFEYSYSYGGYSMDVDVTVTQHYTKVT